MPDHQRLRETPDMQSSAPEHAHWLLWDGECGFCRECVRWVIDHDRHARFRAIPYQEAPSPPMSEELREKCREAVHVVTSTGEAHSAGMAYAFVLEQIGYERLGRFMQRRAFRPFVEWGYRRVSNNRGFFGRLIFGKKCATQA